MLALLTQALAGATHNVFVAVFLTGAIGSVLANVINNQVWPVFGAETPLRMAFSKSQQAAGGIEHVLEAHKLVPSDLMLASIMHSP